MADPHITTLIKDSVTTLAVIVGGGWAIWKWGFSEVLRRRREIPALDGELSTSSVPLDADKVLVTVDVTWSNRGPYPVRIDTGETSLYVYELEETMDYGPVAIPENAEPAYGSLPFEGFVAVIVSPKTTKHIQNHFVLDKRKKYLIGAVVVLQQREVKTFRDVKGYVWYKRELIWPCPTTNEDSSSQPEATN